MSKNIKSVLSYLDYISLKKLIEDMDHRDSTEAIAILISKNIRMQEEEIAHLKFIKEKFSTTKDTYLASKLLNYEHFTFVMRRSEGIYFTTKEGEHTPHFDIKLTTGDCKKYMKLIHKKLRDKILELKRIEKILKKHIEAENAERMGKERNGGDGRG